MSVIDTDQDISAIHRSLSRFGAALFLKTRSTSQILENLFYGFGVAGSVVSATPLQRYQAREKTKNSDALPWRPGARRVRTCTPIWFTQFD
jgi:hypothetical protein